MSGISSAEFRQACAKFATGVAVITAVAGDGSPQGMTVNSFTSVSLEPPLVLVCIERQAAILPLLAPGAYCGINVLSEQQKQLSVQFSQKGDRFNGVAWVTGRTGVPLLRGAIATFESRIVRWVEGGDHVIVLGEAIHLATCEGNPLLYFDSRYRILG
jgi:3-hydroxy-9,10-secoandrosta-1,3,5(10)-triene-9,17-dione monooxygenase reductase component